MGNATGDEEPTPLLHRTTGPVEFVPPDGIRPGQVGTLLDEQANLLDVTATIVDLAVRGLAHDHGARTRRAAPSPPRLRAHRRRPRRARARRSPTRRCCCTKLFDNRTTVKLSDLKYQFRASLEQDPVGDVRRHREAGLVPHPPRRHPAPVDADRGRRPSSSGSASPCGSRPRARSGSSRSRLVVTGIALLIAAGRMPARTGKGTAMLSRVRGFRRLFDEGEEDTRARFAEQHDIFSQYLPYAIVFGCTKKWAKAFEGIAAEQLETVVVRRDPPVQRARARELDRPLRHDGDRHDVREHAVVVGIERLQRRLLRRRRRRWRRRKLVTPRWHEPRRAPRLTDEHDRRPRARPRRRRSRRAALRGLVVDLRRARRRLRATRGVAARAQAGRRAVPSRACCSTTCPSSGCCSARPRSAAPRSSASTRPAAAPSSPAICSTPTARCSSPSRRTSTCSKARATSCRADALFVVDTPGVERGARPARGRAAPRRGGRPGRHLHADLHVGHHRRTESRAHEPRQAHRLGIEPRRPLPAHARRRVLLGDAAVPLERGGRRATPRRWPRARPPCCADASRRAASSPTCASTA